MPIVNECIRCRVLESGNKSPVLCDMCFDHVQDVRDRAQAGVFSAREVGKPETEEKWHFDVNFQPTHYTGMIRDYKWTVSIPKSKTGLVITFEHLSWWQRMWMRFIGWGVEKV